MTYSVVNSRDALDLNNPERLHPEGTVLHTSDDYTIISTGKQDRGGFPTYQLRKNGKPWHLSDEFQALSKVGECSKDFPSMAMFVGVSLIKGSNDGEVPYVEALLLLKALQRYNDFVVQHTRSEVREEVISSVSEADGSLERKDELLKEEVIYCEQGSYSFVTLYFKDEWGQTYRVYELRKDGKPWHLSDDVAIFSEYLKENNPVEGSFYLRDIPKICKNNSRFDLSFDSGIVGSFFQVNLKVQDMRDEVRLRNSIHSVKGIGESARILKVLPKLSDVVLSQMRGHLVAACKGKISRLDEPLRELHSAILVALDDKGAKKEERRSGKNGLGSEVQSSSRDDDGFDDPFTVNVKMEPARSYGSLDQGVESYGSQPKSFTFRNDMSFLNPGGARRKKVKQEGAAGGKRKKGGSKRRFSGGSDAVSAQRVKELLEKDKREREQREKEAEEKERRDWESKRGW